MDGRASAETIGAFAAVGDSFTEGLNDRLTENSFRGWADRFRRRGAGRVGARLGRLWPARAVRLRG